MYKTLGLQPSGQEQQTDHTDEPNAGLKITLLNNGSTYTIDNSTDFDEFTTFITRRTPLPADHQINYLDTGAAWVPLVSAVVYKHMIAQMPPNKPIPVYVLPKSTPTLNPTTARLPQKASSTISVPAPDVLEPTTGLPTLPDPEEPSDESLTILESLLCANLTQSTASTPSNCQTTGVTPEPNSAATSQTLDFDLTPAPSPAVIPTPPHMPQLTDALSPLPGTLAMSPETQPVTQPEPTLTVKVVGLFLT